MNTLLIVEDEKESRQAVKTIVRRSGVPVSNIMECGDGRTALEILENQQVDLMLTGIRMPGMDGVSLVEAIQGLKHKPLVAESLFFTVNRHAGTPCSQVGMIVCPEK